MPVTSMRLRSGIGRDSPTCATCSGDPSDGVGRMKNVTPQRASGRIKSKDVVRRSVGGAVEKGGVSRFPGAKDRIPTFANARGASGRLAKHAAWKRAKVVK